MSMQGLPLRAAYGTGSGQPVGHGQEAPDGLPAVAAVVRSITRTTGLAIPRDARRRPTYGPVVLRGLE